MDCKICGAKNISPSMGSDDICGACDCYGFCPRCKILTEEIKRLQKIKGQEYCQCDIPQALNTCPICKKLIKC